MEKVSIIVPVYNAETYLDECLTSISIQTYTNIEVLLIDDGSIDGSGIICENYAKNDNRFRYVKLKNQGVSNARNYGVNLATGDYVTFIDSDDYISKEYISNLYIKMNDDTGFVVSNYCVVDAGVIVNNNDFRIDGELFSGDVYKDYYFLGFQTLTCWGKLYKLNIIKQNNILFPNDMINAEDQVFNYRYFRCVRKFQYTDGSIYYYRITNAQSLSRKKNNKALYSEYKNILLKRRFLDVCEVKYKELIMLEYAIRLLCQHGVIDDRLKKYIFYYQYPYKGKNRWKFFLLKNNMYKIIICIVKAKYIIKNIVT